jgi:hypothetical protein
MLKSRRKRWMGHLARMGEKRNTYRLLLSLRNPEGKIPLVSPRHGWVSVLRLDHREIG